MKNTSKGRWPTSPRSRRRSRCPYCVRISWSIPTKSTKPRAAGADAVLLIAECLTEPLLIDLLILATELKLSTLVEVHDLESLIQVRHHIGFPQSAVHLAGHQQPQPENDDHGPVAHDRCTARSPRQIHPRQRIRHPYPRRHRTPRQITASTRVLVGEHLMKQPDPGKALAELIGKGLIPVHLSPASLGGVLQLAWLGSGLLFR